MTDFFSNKLKTDTGKEIGLKLQMVIATKMASLLYVLWIYRECQPALGREQQVSRGDKAKGGREAKLRSLITGLPRLEGQLTGWASTRYFPSLR